MKNEVPTPAPDGANKDFAVTGAISEVYVWANGLLRKSTDSDFGSTVVLPSTVRFGTAPPAGTKLIFKYRSP